MIEQRVNGAEQSFNGEPEMPLLWYLRDILGLTGSKRSRLCGPIRVRTERRPLERSGRNVPCATVQTELAPGLERA
jgi:hypothetical protein